MYRLSLLACLALAACGGSDEEVDPEVNSTEELENRLEALHELQDPLPPQRLAYLQAADLGPEMRAGPACRLHQNGVLLLVANASGAVARVDGRRVPLAISGPVGPTGGFFKAPGVTVSVGRTTPFAGNADSYVAGWPARATVGGSADIPPEKHEATWICSR